MRILLETDRLIITEMTMDMAMDVHKNSLDEDTERFVPDEVFRTPEDAKETLEFLISRYGTTEGPFVYALITKEENKNIGYVQLVSIGDGKWETGYHVAKAFTGKGYATEAVAAFLPVMAERFGISEVYGIRLTENAASGRVLEKCGFKNIYTGEGTCQGSLSEISRSVRKMKAWEMARELFLQAKPIVLSAEEQTWEEKMDVSVFYDQNLALDWGSSVPGSGAPEKIMVAAVQALENRGYKVSDAGYRYLMEGLKAAEKKDYILLHRYSALLRRELAQAEKDPESEYWKYKYYGTFEEYREAVKFPESKPVCPDTASFHDQIRAGWLGQLIGGAMGTMVEGYSAGKIYDTFGEVRDYLREPNTYNDDTTYELAFLEAFSEKGYAVTSEDIALSWVGLIPCGWSAEELAIRNLKNGIFPPESGQYCNPFNEWIGAQMRAGICGMAAPGDPETAAELAWKDGCISHANNGILGEVFNAVMTSLSFVEKDIRTILKTAISLIPSDSEYRSVLDFVWDSCKRHDDWRTVLAECEEKYKKYNWIHAYPNACCEVIALYFGDGDFSETLHIITMCGLDADCNAGMVMPIAAIREGCSAIPEKYMHPAFERLTTYMRGKMRETTMDELVEMTVQAVMKAAENQA